MPSPYLFGIDEETGGISPLPASPLLLPAAILLGFVWLLMQILYLLPERKRIRHLRPEHVPKDVYDEHKRHYYRLRHSLPSEWRGGDGYWFDKSQRPYWANGEHWFYHEGP